MRFDRERFFDGYRGIAGSLSQSQVEGIEFLLDKIEDDPEWENIAQIAYVLSTTEHETARTFRPIKEYRSKPGSKGRARQDKYWFTGYFGRGFVQLTHKENYEHYGIADEPNQALDPDKAYEILSDGMRNGVFTTHKLGTYVNKNRKDYFNARKVVNGLDKAQQIADRARAFESILMESAELETEEEPTRHHAAKPVKVETPAPAKPEPPKPDDGSVQTVEGNPPRIEVQPRGTSIVTKAASAAAAAGPVLSAVGLKVGGFEFKTGGLIAIAAVIIVGMIIAAFLWNAAQNRRHEELKLSIQNLADKNKLNVVAADAKT